MADNDLGSDFRGGRKTGDTGMDSLMTQGLISGSDIPAGPGGMYGSGPQSVVFEAATDVARSLQELVKMVLAGQFDRLKSGVSDFFKHFFGRATAEEACRDTI